jgi:hypothetical protein
MCMSDFFFLTTITEQKGQEGEPLLVRYEAYCLILFNFKFFHLFIITLIGM